jgi:AcrR family transcriptional regulator
VRIGLLATLVPVTSRNGVVISVDSPRNLTAPDVLQDATLLVVSVGVNRFSMRELARRLGCQPAALYHYFSSKEAILQAVAVQTAHRLIEAMFGSEARITDLHACTQVCKRIEIFMAFASQEPNLWELLFLDARAAAEGQRARLEIERRLTDPVAACRLTNRVTTGSAAASARAIVAITIGEVAGQVCRPWFGGPARSARQIAELFLGAVPP